jgi:DNA-binding SARP family transcriptional activator
VWQRLHDAVHFGCRVRLLVRATAGGVRESARLGFGALNGLLTRMQFRILGLLEVADGDSVVPLAGAKLRALLGLLLLSANEVVSSDRLIEELWGGSPPGSAAKLVQVYVSQLRKALGSAGELVVTRAPGYLLRVEGEQLDLYRFERLVREADAAEPAVAAARLREALALWRGPALADLSYESFAQPAIRRLEELRLAALEMRVDADLALGRLGELVAELEALVAEYPLREHLWAQLMLALYRCGRQADALAAYQDARRALVEQLGIEPSPPLRELEQAILRQDPSLELAAAAAPDRSLLVVALRESALGALLSLAAPLARQPGRELVIARLLDDRHALAAQSAAVQDRRELLRAAGIAARAAAFTSITPAADAVRMAAELDCDLILVDAPADLLESPVLRAILAAAPCDVGALVGGEPARGPLLVPFVGVEHDWTAIELGAWLAGGWQVPLRLAGPSLDDRDSSRLLASASLAVQHAYGIAAEPLLLAPGADQLVRASADASLVIVGLPERWQQEGLGPARAALAQLDTTPALLVRRGLRPSGLAPPESRTRFTWTLRPQSA